MDDAKTPPLAAPTRFASPIDRPAPPDAFHAGMNRLMQTFAWPRLFDGGPLAFDGGPLGPRIDAPETDDVLRIRAEKKIRANLADDAFQIVERAHGVFERAIAVPHGVKPEEVTTGVSDGALTIPVSKPAEAAPRAARIPV